MNKIKRVKTPIKKEVDIFINIDTGDTLQSEIINKQFNVKI